MFPKPAIQSDLISLSGYLLQGLIFEDSDSELRHQFQSHCGVACNAPINANPDYPPHEEGWGLVIHSR